jgi:WD40 repeat protein
MCPTSDAFLTASRDGTFKLWDLRAPNCQASGSLDSSSGFADGPIASFDNSGRVFAVVTPMRCEIRCVSRVPDCRPRHISVFIVFAPAALALFNASDVSSPPFELTHFPLLEFSCNPAPIPGRGASQVLPPRLPQRIAWTSLEFSPDDRFIALATSDRGVLLVDSFYPTRELALLQEHAYDPLQSSTISFSPDGHFLAVGVLPHVLFRFRSLLPHCVRLGGAGGADGHVFAYDLTKDPELSIGKTSSEATRECFVAVVCVCSHVCE